MATIEKNIRPETDYKAKTFPPFVINGRINNKLLSFLGQLKQRETLEFEIDNVSDWALIYGFMPETSTERWTLEGIKDVMRFTRDLKDIVRVCLKYKFDKDNPPLKDWECELLNSAFKTLSTEDGKDMIHDVFAIAIHYRWIKEGKGPNLSEVKRYAELQDIFFGLAYECEYCKDVFDKQYPAESEQETPDTNTGAEIQAGEYTIIFKDQSIFHCTLEGLNASGDSYKIEQGAEIPISSISELYMTAKIKTPAT